MMSTNQASTTSASRQSEVLLWLGPVAYMFAVGLYFVGRYSGLWAESDSSALTNAIRAFSEEGRLVPDSIHIYSNGYTYQAVSSFLVGVMGIEVASLQQVIYPLLACLVVLPAWLLYRELIGSVRGAAIGTILLFTQPEFLFVIMRSSHEKFTRALMLLCLFLLIRSIHSTGKNRLLIVYVALFYIAAYALIASNAYIAHSFIFALGIALIAGSVLQRRNAAIEVQNRPSFDRLPYVIAAAIAGVYLFSFYIYPPALHQVSVFESIWEHLTALFLGTEFAEPTNAYTAMSTGWRSIEIYFLLTIANWIVIGASFVIWVYQGYRWFWVRGTPRTRTSNLVWLLYAAFAGQGLISVIIDFSGALSSNAQQRLFPSISIFAVAIVASALVNWQPKQLGSVFRVALPVAIGIVAVLTVFKATNEPLVSNTWSFYRSTEIAALDWSNAHLADARIWTEYDERLVVAYHTTRGEPESGNSFYGHGGSIPIETRTLIVSDITRLRSDRISRELPVPPDAFRVYDNGEAEVYHLRPDTPYQR